MTKPKEGTNDPNRESSVTQPEPSVAEKVKTEIACAGCPRTVKIIKRLPSGWKHLGPLYYCGDCWHSRYVLRAILFQVVSPVSVSWEDLRKILKALWVETTRASNWLVRELSLRDVMRDPGIEKMPAMQPVYLYPQARKQFPTLPPQTVVSLEQAVTKRYKRRRYEVIWICQAALPTYRYPQPLPIHNQSWSVEMQNDSPLLRVRLGNKDQPDGTRDVVLRLKGTPRRTHQLRAFRAILAGEAITGECAIYEVRSGDRNEIMAKLVAWIPRPDVAQQKSGVLRVHTAIDALLVAVNEKDEKLWVYHADHIPRWRMNHRKYLDALSDDTKFEQRPVPSFVHRRENVSLKYHRRINTAADQAAAYLVRYAVRRRFARIAYDDSEHGFCGDFVWYRLESRIRTICDEYAIEFEKTAKPEKPPDEEK